MQLSNTHQGIEPSSALGTEVDDQSQADSSSRFMQFVSVTHPELDSRFSQALRFSNQFTGWMELYADTTMVSEYLESHQGWFCRCAQPMKVDPVGNNGYILSLGRYGSFGFDVEPQIGLQLLPPDEGVYRITTIPVPHPLDHCYQVDFQASQRLIETSDVIANGARYPQTSVEWDLALEVAIVFPPFILRLPHQLIQATGDKVLKQIVRQISQRLTKKVQDDFHQTHGITCP